MKREVKLWKIRKLVDSDDAGSVLYEIPDEYRPVLDTSSDSVDVADGYTFYDVSIGDLLSKHLLLEGQRLHMSYKPRNGERRQYEATVTVNGCLETLGEAYSAPSYAALACIQDAGSDRQTVNGWTSWRDNEEHTLAELRDQFLEIQNNPVT